MDTVDRPGQTLTATPSRRTIVKGAAWAVPTVVVASAVPTVAASCLGANTVDSGEATWDVGSNFVNRNTCSQNKHPDYVLKFSPNFEECAAPGCTPGTGKGLVMKITVTLNHDWGYWLAWQANETLARTYYAWQNTAYNCIDPGDKCSDESYTSAGISVAGTSGTKNCGSSFIVVPNSGDSGYNCHATNAVNDGIHINPCKWNNNGVIYVPYTWQLGLATLGQPDTFAACSGTGTSGSGSIAIAKPSGWS